MLGDSRQVRRVDGLRVGLAHRPPQHHIGGIVCLNHAAHLSNAVGQRGGVITGLHLGCGVAGIGVAGRALAPGIEVDLLDRSGCLVARRVNHIACYRWQLGRDAAVVLLPHIAGVPSGKPPLEGKGIAALGVMRGDLGSVASVSIAITRALAVFDGIGDNLVAVLEGHQMLVCLNTHIQSAKGHRSLGGALDVVIDDKRCHALRVDGLGVAYRPTRKAVHATVCRSVIGLSRQLAFFKARAQVDVDLRILDSRAICCAQVCKSDGNLARASVAGRCLRGLLLLSWCDLVAAAINDLCRRGTGNLLINSLNLLDHLLAGARTGRVGHLLAHVFKIKVITQVKRLGCKGIAARCTACAC